LDLFEIRKKEIQMKRSNLIGGVICLSIAALLTVLNLTLPEENLMFMVGEQNMPWVPPAILGIIGVVLLATGGRAQEAAEAEAQMVIDEDKAVLNKRLEQMGWGFFLIMLGGFALVPEDIVPRGAWSIGLGLIFLGLNLARYLNQIKMSGFTTFLGVVSLVSGVLELMGLYQAEGAILLIILGLYVLVKPYFDRRQLFGKAESGPPLEE
jgi:hypothetical protein